MKFRYCVYFLLISLAFAACQKNQMSNIPQIGLKFFGSQNGSDTVILNLDTPVLQFSLSDGDADLGNDPNGSQKDIYILDHRPLYDTGYAGYFFPSIDQSIEQNAKDGITGTCTFLFLPAILQSRPDSIHQKYGDTVYFSVFIVDRSGRHSDTITTNKVYLLP